MKRIAIEISPLALAALDEIVEACEMSRSRAIECLILMADEIHRRKESLPKRRRDEQDL